MLLNATFGIVAMVSYNIGNPVYPVASPGASLRLETDAVTVRAAVYDGEQVNRHGVPTELGDHALAIGELDLASTLKLGAWHHTSRGSGYFAVADRQLARRLGAFARLSVARSEEGAQTAIEATYQLLVRKWLTIQPDASSCSRARARRWSSRRGRSSRCETVRTSSRATGIAGKETARLVRDRGVGYECTG